MAWCDGERTVDDATDDGAVVGVADVDEAPLCTAAPHHEIGSCGGDSHGTPDSVVLDRRGDRRVTGVLRLSAAGVGQAWGRCGGGPVCTAVGRVSAD